MNQTVKLESSPSTANQVDTTAPDFVPTHPSPLREFWATFSQNKGAVIGLCLFAVLLFCAIFAPILAPHDPIEQYRDFMLTPPSWTEGGNPQFLLGTDEVGRDILSRLMHGAQLSMGVGFISVILSMIPGIILGLIAAFFPKYIGAFIMRVVDITMAFPFLLLAIVIVIVLSPSLATTVVAVSIVNLPAYVRMMRAEAMSQMNRDYVMASRVSGAGLLRIMFVSVLPNCMAPLIVQGTMGFSSAILEIAALGFLGMGIQPPAAEWGTMLSSARDYISSAWWVVTFPGITILISVLSINLMGDGLRDALDPKMKKIG
jgi:dipeptide transport system permease protein